MTLTPLASLTYSYLNQGSYTESGGNGAALSVGSSHASSVKSSLGAKLEKGFATSYGEIVPELQAARGFVSQTGTVRVRQLF